MERRTGPDPGLDAEGTAAWDTLSTVAVSLVLLLFALLLSLQAVRLQRDSLDARSGEAASAPEITGLRRAAGALVLPPLAFFFRLALARQKVKWQLLIWCTAVPEVERWY